MADQRREISPNAVYTLQDVTELLQVSDATLRRWLKEGKARSGRVGRSYRFLGRQLLDMLSASETGPTEEAAPAPNGRRTRARANAS